jgi:hypothetical protein
MTTMDPKPMPPAAITAAGWIILLAAVGGFALGAVSKLKGAGGPDADSGEVVAPIKTVANAQALVAPPVTEADVRRWAREELQASAAAHAARKAKEDTDTTGDAPDIDPTPPPLPIVPGQPVTGAVPTPKQPAQQIPF